MGALHSFPTLFSFFLFLFFRFSYDFLSSFLYFFLVWEWGWRGKWRSKISLSLSFLPSFFGKKNGAQLEKMKGVLSLFLLFSLDFFVLTTLLFFSFLGKEMGNWEDKNECPKHAKRNLQEHLLFQQNQITLSRAKTIDVKPWQNRIVLDLVHLRMDKVFFFSLTLPARIFSLSFSIFISF